MRFRMWLLIAVLVVSFAVALPAAAVAIEQETQGLVQQQLLALRTTDGIRIKDAACSPLSYHFSVSNQRVFGDQWACMLADGLSRAYQVRAFVRNTTGGGLAKLVVLACYRDFSKFACPRGAKIVLPTTG